MGGSQSSQFGKRSTAKEVVDAFGGKGSLQGKTAVVTGGNSGIGLETCKALSYAGARVVLASRSKEGGEKAVRDEVAQPGEGGYTASAENIVVKALDLEDLDSVKQFADYLNESETRIDLLVFNAGIMALPTLERTKHGFEKQIGVNHFGHFYLYSLLEDKLLRQTFPSRVVVLSSTAHALGSVKVNDLHFKNGRAYGQWEAYGQSKAANLLFAKQIADRHLPVAEGGVFSEPSQVTALSLHPGVIATNLIRYSKINTGILGFFYHNFFVDKNIPQGASTTLYGCLAPELSGTAREGRGVYLSDCAVTRPNAQAQDVSKELRKRLWAVTEEQLAEALKK